VKVQRGIVHGPVLTYRYKNFIVVYTLLVILPLLGLAGVLNYGRRLRAPLPVDGLWYFETSCTGMAQVLDVRPAVAIRNDWLMISQSGRSLALTFGSQPKSGAIGLLEGNTITASILLPLALRLGAGCESDRKLILNAVVLPDIGPTYLMGVLNPQDCAQCTAIEFHAVRKGPAITEGKY
jgi:hypothetical protein